MPEPVTKFTRLIGLTADPDAPGGARATLEVAAHHKNGNGVVHGSVLHALLDTAMGVEARRARKCARIATAEISVRFLAPASSGTLVARARVVKVGKRLVVVSGELWLGGEEGTLVAVAQGTFVPIAETGPGPDESWSKD